MHSVTTDQPPETAPEPMAKRRLLTTREACEWLWGELTATTKDRLYRAYRAGNVKSVKLSGWHYWPLDQLEKLIENPTGWQGDA